MDLLASLNPAQREAVAYLGGPMLVVAGAGSGKTRVITYKVAYLIDQGFCEPDRILAVTFTNKAAEEMKERIQVLLGQPSGRPPLISTFHSFCTRLLRQEIEALGISRDFTIYDSDDQRRLVKQIMQELGLPQKDPTPEVVLGRISRAKNNQVDPADFPPVFFGPVNEVAGRVSGPYQASLATHGALDLDDLLLKAIQVLRDHEMVRDRWNRRFKYILVDEFQDTNPPQFALIRFLTVAHRNICVVGDEDQSIYGFRGAIIANILNFERDFPGARIFKLEQNYRSTRAILKAASALIAHNRERREKTLWTDNSEGTPLVLHRALDPREEADWVARSVRDLLLEEPAASVGVLYRANFQSRQLEDGLKRQSVAYRMVGGISFYSRKEIKDLTAYLRLAQNPNDTVAFLRVINTPPRGVGERTVEFLRQRAAQGGLSLWDALAAETDGETLSARGRASLQQFRDTIGQLAQAARDQGLPRLVEQAFVLSGYRKWLEEAADPEARGREENIREFINAALEHERGGGTLASFLDRAALFGETDQVQGAGRVDLLTLHSAKGLEFDHVFIVGLENGILPHRRSQASDRDIAEERRLLYVGITRARRRLALSYAMTRLTFESNKTERSEPSFFLQDIPRDCLLEVDAFSPFPTGGRPARPARPVARLKTQGFSSYDTVEEIKSFFQNRGDRTEPAAPATPVRQDPPRPARAGGGPGGRPLPGRLAPAAPAGPAPSQIPAAPSPAGASAPARWKLGQRVRHAAFGTGTILRIEKSTKGNKLTISFDNRGVRQMLESLAQLEKLP